MLPGLGLEAWWLLAWLVAWLGGWGEQCGGSSVAWGEAKMGLGERGKHFRRVKFKRNLLRTSSKPLIHENTEAS